jgi:hypothetical protein
VQTAVKILVLARLLQWYPPFPGRCVRNREFVPISVFKTSYNQARFRMVSVVANPTASFPPTAENTFVTVPHPDPSSLPVQAGI